MKTEKILLIEEDVVTESGLPAKAVHDRLSKLAVAHRRVDAALCFYLMEVESRALFREIGHASTVDYARECLGLEDRKTRTLLRLAMRFQELPKVKEAFGRGDIPYTKAREVVRVATPDNEESWIDKCGELTNRQLEIAVKRELPPEQTRSLGFFLDESRIAAWERVCEVMERLAGKTLSEIEVFDLMCASAMLEHDLTPPLGEGSEAMTGYVAQVIERDGFRCTRPGCSNRSALQGSHIEPRSQGGSDEPSNIHTACSVCHQAIERGILTVRGSAPDNITWEGPFGVIESPRPVEPADPANPANPADLVEPARQIEPVATYADVVAVREPEPSYGDTVAKPHVPRGTRRRPTTTVNSYGVTGVGRARAAAIAARETQDGDGTSCARRSDKRSLHL